MQGSAEHLVRWCGVDGVLQGRYRVAPQIRGQIADAQHVCALRLEGIRQMQCPPGCEEHRIEQLRFARFQVAQ
ncbi:hypothetical protein [Embleya sp. NPDC005575]|uniref:hypothetical protein n=1 Tax=Embleya sp. NPDC005575 TaxID=3156892 RepID=UPI0033A903C4